LTTAGPNLVGPPRSDQVNYGLADTGPGDAPGHHVPQPGPADPQGAMNGQPLVRTVTIRDPQGLHMRPAAAFAKVARQYQSSVTIRRKDQAVNGKSQLDLMLLAAEPGAELTLEVAGDDAAAAMPVLADLIEGITADGGDDPGPPPKG
jgi:phosphotransferase system HPr (HPr) family protein